MDKIIIIAGPTGVGKTSLSIELAHRLNGEIISGDSMQVYKEMTIGTAKIQKVEMQGITHYLIDELSYTDEYNVKVFQDKARSYIKDILSRGKVPIICGGTGLYMKSVLYDYRFLEQDIDKKFESFLHERSNSQLYAMLRIVDEEAITKIHKNNRQRMIRALMMAHIGEKKSDIVASQKHEPMYDAFIIGLTMEREQLYKRIDERVHSMIKQGLLEEIKRLIKDQSVWELQSMQGIGYKEWKGYFDNVMSQDECIQLIQKNSRNFAKKQYTWFRNQMPIKWYDIQKEDWKKNILHDIEEWKLVKLSNG